MVRGLSGRLLEHEILDLLLVLFFLVKIEHGAKDAVPDGAADAKTFALIFVVMQVMVTPERLHPFKWRIPGVDGIVHAAIKEITEQEAGEEHKAGRPHRQPKDRKKRRGDDQAGHGRHEQTFFVPRIVVMVPMHDIDELLRPLALGDPMECEPVHDVFKEGPAEHSDKKDQEDMRNGVAVFGAAIV